MYRCFAAFWCGYLNHAVLCIYLCIDRSHLFLICLALAYYNLYAAYIRFEHNRTEPYRFWKWKLTPRCVTNEFYIGELRGFDTTRYILRIKIWYINRMFLDGICLDFSQNNSGFSILCSQEEKFFNIIQICWSSVEMRSTEATNTLEEQKERVCVRINWFLTRFGGCTFRKCVW